MKLSISNIGWSADKDYLLYEAMARMGYSGLEIAPSRIFSENPYDHKNEASAWAKKICRNFNLSISSMQSIWYGRKEMLFGSVEERELLFAYTMKAVDFANAIGCGNLVFGSPVNRRISESDDPNHAIPFFKKIGDYAITRGTVIAIEANPPIYNTNYINDTVSALELIDAVGSDGFRLNLDTGTMIENKENINDICRKAYLINHVHISEPYLQCIQKRPIHQEIASMLRDSDYKGFISIEVGRQNSIEPLIQMMDYIKEIFE